MEFLEVNKIMIFIVFEWIDFEFLILIVDIEDFLEFFIFKEILKIVL